MAHFWPGPLTVLLPKNDSVPEWVTGESPFVGVRMPNHALTIALIKECGFPLAAPSANPFSKISPTTAQMVDHYFKEDAVFVVTEYMKILSFLFVLDGGPCSSGLESTIVGFENNQVKVYRLGALSLEAITAVVGEVRYEGKPDKVFFTPGRFPKHYAPNTPVVLTEDLESTLTLYGEDTTRRIAVLSYSPLQNLPENCQLFSWEINDNWEAAAQQLYATLFSIDRMQFELMIIQKFPDIGLGKTINDRLNRASIQ